METLKNIQLIQISKGKPEFSIYYRRVISHTLVLRQSSQNKYPQMRP